MKLLLQRVSQASVTVDDECTGKIARGILLFAGIEKQDNDAVLERMADKVLAYRIFPDAEGKMNKNVREIMGGILVVSQFTLAAETNKGLRPSFSSAAPPQAAEQLYAQFVQLLQQKHHEVQQGRFAANMQVQLINDGPVTFLLEM